MFKAGPDDFPPAFDEALVQGGSVPRGRRTPSAYDVVDEDYAEHSQRTSKWIIDGYSALIRRLFWKSMYIGHISRKPIAHLQRWLCKHNGEDIMCKLVFGMATFIAECFDNLLSDEDMTGWRLLLDSIGNAPEQHDQEVFSACVRETLQTAA